MAIQIRRGSQAAFDNNYQNIVSGEPCIATDTGRFFIGTGDGTYIELAKINGDVAFATAVIANIDYTISSTEYAEIAMSLATPYSTTETYYKGQFVTRVGHVYEAKQDITTAESWTAAHWTQLD